MVAPTKEESRGLVKGLVEKYLRDKEKWRTRNESETRAQFLDPMLKALGWDFDSPDEVRMELKVLDEESKKKIDYVLLINGVEKLIVEAKAIKEDISKIQYSRQAIEYAYNLSCSWSVLTNFEGLKIFYVGEEGAIFRDIQLANMERFDENFENLWLISHESFLIGTIERKAEDEGRKRRTVSIDNDLLESLNDWRERIYRDIKFRYGKKYSDDLIEEIVQKVIDRLIFIRKIEDMRGKRILEQLVRQDPPDMYRELKKTFDQFNEDYNSKLFGETKDDKHETDVIDLSNSTLTQVIEGMYRPKGRTVDYNFAILDADILGRIYEQYLGHILKKTKIVEGKNHRREQGIYYTPTYIVEYIIKNTIGELLKDKKIDREKIRVLDSACGSGSFLIKAYDYLLRYRKLKEGADAQSRLDFEQGVTFTRKTHIITENIFGVDLDVKAVEIAQLNLLLKIAEFKERLPTLRNNIQVGNSIICDEKVAPRAFDWNDRFSKIMKEGGFHAIVGNPPYIMIENVPDEFRSYLYENYAIGKRFDVFQAFIEKGIDLLKEDGLLGYILPNTFLIGSSFKEFRKKILEKTHILQIVDLPQGIFAGVTVDNVILILQKKSQVNLAHKVLIRRMSPRADPGNLLENKWNIEFTIPQRIFYESKGFTFNINLDPVQKAIFDKMEQNSIRLGEVTESSQGIIIYKTEEDSEANKYTSFAKKDGSWKKLLRGREIGRYRISWAGEYLKYGKWLWSPRDEKFFNQPKILLQALRNKALTRRLIATFDPDGVYYNAHNLANIIAKDQEYPLLFILPIFNSKAANFWYKAHFPNVNINPNDFRQLPIPKNVSAPAKKNLISLAEKMLSLNERLVKIGDKLTDERTQIEEDIKKTDEKIDEIVYQIYGITEEQKKVIESTY